MTVDKAKVDKYKEKHENDARRESDISPILNGESDEPKSRKKQRRHRSELADDSEHDTKRHRHRKHKKTHSKDKHRERTEHKHQSTDKNDLHGDDKQQSYVADVDRHGNKQKHSDKNSKQNSSDRDLPHQRQKHDLW